MILMIQLWPHPRHHNALLTLSGSAAQRFVENWADNFHQKEICTRRGRINHQMKLMTPKMWKGCNKTRRKEPFWILENGKTGAEFNYNCNNKSEGHSRWRGYSDSLLHGKLWAEENQIWTNDVLIITCHNHHCWPEREKR